MVGSFRLGWGGGCFGGGAGCARPYLSEETSVLGNFSKAAHAAQGSCKGIHWISPISYCLGCSLEELLDAWVHIVQTPQRLLHRSLHQHAGRGR